MIVKKIDNQAFHRSRRKALPGKGFNLHFVKEEKGFQQYLLEAFQGELSQDRNNFSEKLSKMQKDNFAYLNKL